MKKCSSTIWKINISQVEKLLNIFGVQMSSKKKNYLIFCYFNIRNFKITKYRSFYISSFQIFTPTRAKLNFLSGMARGYAEFCIFSNS